MTEKKFGLGTVLLASGAAALVAGGVVAYLKREELKKFAEDVMARAKSEDEDDNLFELEDDDLFEEEDDFEEEVERDIVLTGDDDEDDEDDEPSIVEIDITIDEDIPAKAAGED